MNIWHDINPERVTPRDFVGFIEIPRGSKKKYELDKETGLIILDRILHTSTQYPANYGFIPRTYADDKDPLDVLVLCSETLDPNTLVRVYPIGVVKMIDQGEGDEKIIAVPFDDPMYNSYKSIFDLPKHIYQEISHFFKIYKQLEGKETEVTDVLGPEEAAAIIGQCIKNYEEKFASR